MVEKSTIAVLAGAGVVGILVGVGTAPTTPGSASPVEAVTAVVSTAAVATGVKRARDPQPGDQWGGCNDARAAGTAPLYSGESGFRSEMDGDGDGIACENYSGGSSGGGMTGGFRRRRSH
ncbi:excalibur calcium-binding domain-containing protein [Sphingomonadaceae bacterium OTU29THOMA1]|nr:excalibur calcium-binding domain-containing protein [Sphingomonadaceae bacterium OTU29THOMA1]